MNILVPYSWLKEFIKTDATPETIAEKLSLCSLSVEKFHKKAGDVIYEIEITPNRYDTLSVLGIARELAAVLPRFNIRAEFAPLNTPKTLKTTNADLLNATITSPELCPRFTAIVLDKVEIKPSPKLVRDRLEMSGIRALNNVVDVSNYLMLELGQPMHIFDFDKIHNGEMILRESRKGEKITTLDGIERELPKGAIVIESGGRLIDLCGIMGGENSAVDENTKRILLFIQIYDPVHIRKTSQSLGLRTEASARFEKGIDPEGIIPAMSRAIEMLKENANTRVASRLVDIDNELWQPHEVELEVPEVENLLGVRIEKEDVVKILKSLGFEVRVKNSALQIPTITTRVPSWRDKDIKIPVDLIEEIARLYGYHNIPNLMPEGAIPSVPREKKFYWEDKAKDFLKHQGFHEVYNYSFTSAEALKKAGFDPKKAIKIKNPLNKDLEYLRPSLLPSLLQNLSQNRYYPVAQGLTSSEVRPLKLFELERIYIPTKNRDLPRENFRLGGVLHNKQRNNLFYVTKGIVEGLLEELGITNIKFETKPQSGATTAFLNRCGLEIGSISLVEDDIVTFDLDFDKISELASDLKSFEPLPKYPPIIEDLSVILPPKTFVGDAVKTIQKQSRLIRGIEILDIYPEKRSATFRITYQSPKRTLMESQVKKIRQKVIRTLKTSLGADVRTS